METDTRIDLQTPVQFVPGVGPTRGQLFERLGVRRAGDLLFYFPRSYQDIAPLCSGAELQDGLRASILGTVVDLDYRQSFPGRSSVGILLSLDGGAFVRCVWYNQPFRREQFSRGQKVLATGQLKSTGVSYQLRHPDVLVLADGESPPPARPMPIYPLTEGLQQRHVAAAVSAVLDLAGGVEEAIPEELRKLAIDAWAVTPSASASAELGTALLGIHDAIRGIHQPETMQQAEQARQRFIFQELFVLQLAMAMHRHRVRNESPSPSIATPPSIHARILKRFPFSLTGDQERAIEDVRADMAGVHPMNRLIQGDVGAGKTVIAEYALLAAVAKGFQAALMAPTELLARQHFRKLNEHLKESKVLVELLSGSIPSRDRRELLQRIAIGTVDIVVGTQALLGDQVDFANLGLLVIDEQHRFGVEQRAVLKQNRTSPHYLVLTATPIPRTLAMTVFGDLDVSIVKDRPPGQSDVKTYLARPEQYERWWKFVNDQLHAGRQAFVVAPRVDAADEESQGAIQWRENLAHGPLQHLRVDLIHGRMEGEEKQQRLEAFERGETQVLVATTVVEVGIDIPNASVMTILDADQLGLAQLHQLRGRVGRGRFPGYVCLFPSPQATQEDWERLEKFARCHDGFALAELDLQLRGPGELLGTRQSGLPPLRIANLSRDADWIFVARDLAQSLIARDPDLQLPKHARLRRQVVTRHGPALEISDVG